MKIKETMIVCLSLMVIPFTANAWVSYNNTDSFTGNKESTISVKSSKITSCGYNAQHARLIIRCSENKTEVFLSTDCHITDSSHNYDYSKVEYKLDDGPIKSFKGSPSTNNRAFFYPYSHIKFIKSLYGHRKLTMRFTPYAKSAETVTFDIEGIKNVVYDVANTCNWKR